VNLYSAESVIPLKRWNWSSY